MTSSQARVLCGVVMLLSMAFGLGSGCHSDEKPVIEVSCGDSQYEEWKKKGGNTNPNLQTQAADDSNGEEHVGQVRNEIINDPGGRDFNVNAQNLREIVQIILYQAADPDNPQPNEWVDYATGTVVGPHTILTAAHTFFDDQPYNAVRVAIRRPNGTWAETPTTRIVTHPNYNDMNGMHNRFDLAYLQVAPDLTREQGLRPLRMVDGYLPRADTATRCCALDGLDMLGYAPVAGGVITQHPTTQPLRGVTTTPLNSVRSVRSTGMLSFLPFTRPGDSGGPVLRNTNGNWEVVGVLLGDQPADNLFSPVNGGGPNLVDVAATLTADVRAPLEQALSTWRSANLHTYITYPEPDATYPNGSPNSTSGDYPENGALGESSEVKSGSHGNGYFIVFPYSSNPDGKNNDDGNCSPL